jgi:hypothetical protein
LPVLITDTARAQYLGMIGRYLQAAPHRPARPQAARRLIETYDAALARIAADPRFWLTHQGPIRSWRDMGFGGSSCIAIGSPGTPARRR